MAAGEKINPSPELGEVCDIQILWQLWHFVVLIAKHEKAGCSCRAAGLGKQQLHSDQVGAVLNHDCNDM